jgi:CheY-like chemotaxis protein
MGSYRIAVLLVEDESLIRMNIVDELEEAGFEVFEAGSAAQALEILEKTPRIRLLFTDVDMPGGMDGVALAAMVRDRWPPIKIIVVSGLRAVDVRMLPAESVSMRKPYLVSEVVQSINNMTP